MFFFRACDGVTKTYDPDLFALVFYTFTGEVDDEFKEDLLRLDLETPLSISIDRALLRREMTA